jgi:glycosyltransferase involved in cell wall biosynthesis
MTQSVLREQLHLAQHITSHKSKPRVLFLINHPIEDPSCRFRIYQFVPYLERAGFACDVRPFTTKALYHAIRGRGRYSTKAIETLRCTARRLGDIIESSRYDLIVIHREAFPFFTPLIEELVLSRHSKVIFGFDDAIYEGHGKTSNLPHPWLYRFKYGSGINQVLKRCALVTPGSNTLAEYARRFNPHVTVVPTVIDIEQYIFREEPENVKPVVVGWFGSRSTSQYLTVVEPALKRLANAFPGEVGFCFYGDSEYQSALPNSAVIPFSVQTEVEELGKIHIGLMPLPDNPWTRGKCSLKALQYMARGVPVITSPVGMAADVVQHGVNGYLARNEQEWFQCLDLLVHSSALRRQFAIQGRKTVERSYSLQTWGPRLASLFNEVLNGGPSQVSS